MSEYGDYTHYDTLEVDEDASQEIIESAYQYLCHKWHPNKHPEQRAEAERRLAALSRAFRVISKPETRGDYDRWLRHQRGLEAGGETESAELPPRLPPTPEKRAVAKKSPPEADFSDVVAAKSPRHHSGNAEHGGSAPSYSPSYLPEGYEYAGFWTRAAALLGDGVVVYVLQFCVSFLVGLSLGVLGIPFPGEATFLAIGVGIAVLYYVIGWGSDKMATPGKRLMGIEVRTEKFERLSYGLATARVLAWSIGAMMLFATYFTQPFTKKRQCLHDMAVGTVVIRRTDTRGSPILIGGALFFASIVMMGVIAAIAFPAYQDYTIRNIASAAYAELKSAASAVTEHDRRGGGQPRSLTDVGFYSTDSSNLWSEPAIYSDEESFFIYVDLTGGGRLAVFPYFDNKDRLLWECYAYSLKEAVVPSGCEAWREQN